MTLTIFVTCQSNPVCALWSVYWKKKKKINKCYLHQIRHDLISDQQAQSPDAAIYITGDFNKCKLDPALSNFHQCVDVPTRKENTLDLFYVNLLDAYKCAALPPLGNSDHDMAQLIPKYRPILKRGKITKETVTIWTEEATQQLQGCLDCTDWDIFIRSSKDIDELCSTVTEYVKFCEDLFIVRKRVLSYPNTKPWVNKEIRSLLKDKQEAFKDKEREKIKTINREIKKKIAI